MSEWVFDVANTITSVETGERLVIGKSLMAEYRRIARAHSQALSRIAELEAEAEKQAVTPDSDKKPTPAPKPFPAGALKPPSGDPSRVGG